MTQKITEYKLVLDGRIVAQGSRAEMLAMKAQVGGKVILAPELRLNALEPANTKEVVPVNKKMQWTNRARAAIMEAVADECGPFRDWGPEESQRFHTITNEFGRLFRCGGQAVRAQFANARCCTSWPQSYGAEWGVQHGHSARAIMQAGVVGLLSVEEVVERLALRLEKNRQFHDAA